MSRMLKSSENLKEKWLSFPLAGKSTAISLQISSKKFDNCLMKHAEGGVKFFKSHLLVDSNSEMLVLME